MRNRTDLRALLVSLALLAVLLILAPLSGVAASQLIYDDFDDNQIDASLWSAYQGDPGPTVSENNQSVEIAYPSQLEGELFGAGYVSVCQLTGDFDIQVDYRLLTWPSANGVRVALVTDTGSVERTSFGNFPDFPDEPREVYLTNFNDEVSGITETTDISGKLRQVRSGNTLSGYYLVEGNWALIHTAEGTTNDTSFGLASWSHDYAFSGQPVNVAFDNVIVNEGELVCPPIEISIDIKPGDLPNSLQPRSKGRIPVAILTTETFAADSVDPSKVLFGASGTEATPSHSAFEDADGDGDTDLILHFNTPETGIQCGDTTALLTGTTTTGRIVVGFDSVSTVGCH